MTYKNVTTISIKMKLHSNTRISRIYHTTDRVEAEAFAKMFKGIAFLDEKICMVWW